MAALRHRALRMASLPLRLLLRTISYYPKILSAYRDRRLGRDNGIVEVVEGTQTFANGRWAIFVIWQPSGLPWYVRNALSSLAEAHTNVIAVVNHRLSTELRQELAAKCAKIIVRDNSGFDFGGFRDATLYALQHLSVDRALYLNDSIFFFEHGLTEFFSRLITSQADACTAFENWERHYHLQSFALSVSGEVFRSERFTGFWKRYLPVSARRWAIHAGEIALSREAILPEARSIDVLYGPNDLLPHLERLTISELHALNRYLPATQRLQPGDFRLRNRALIDQILMTRIPSRSQIHTAGFLAHRFLGCPIIKRDLVYRLQFTIYDVECCLNEAGTTEHLNAVISEMRRKGPGTQLPLIRRLQFLDGII